MVNPAIVFTSPYSPLVLSDDDSYQEALDATEMLSQFWEGTASANELSLARALIVHVVLAYPDLREAVFERASIVARGLSGSVRWCFEGWSKASDTLR